MARNMEIREIPNVGAAIVPRLVCVGGFGPFYGLIAGEENLPKKVSHKKKKAETNKQTTPVVVLGQFKPEQIHIVRWSCKGRFRDMSDKHPDDDYGWSYAGYRNGGRKPRYKDHIGRVGKAGEMRAKYKRPTEINLAT